MRYIYTIYTKYHYKNIFQVTQRRSVYIQQRSHYSQEIPAAPVVSNVGTRCSASCQVSMKKCFSVSKNYVNVGHTRKCKRSTIHTIHYLYYHNRKLFLCACWLLDPILNSYDWEKLDPLRLARNITAIVSTGDPASANVLQLGNKLFTVYGWPASSHLILGEPPTVHFAFCWLQSRLWASPSRLHFGINKYVI